LKQGQNLGHGGLETENVEEKDREGHPDSSFVIVRYRYCCSWQVHLVKETEVGLGGTNQVANANDYVHSHGEVMEVASVVEEIVTIVDREGKVIEGVGH